jgi:sugar phosphate isomerase/epimerase
MRFFRLLTALLLLGLAGLSYAEPKLGLQSWTCRNMTFEQVMDFATKHGITQLEFIGRHLDPTAPLEETLRKKAQLAERGLTAYSFGVAGTTLDKEKDRHLFEFARLMNMKMIVVEPKEAGAWDHLEALVKEYDIRLAIHNHGIGTVYGDPATVRKVLATRDPRIGVCLDVGWITAAGFDAAEIFRAYGDRVFDIHFKDKRVEKAADGTLVPIDTEVGQGQANYTELFAAIKELKWSGVMAIETDSKAFAEDPNRIVSEAKTFFGLQR